MRSLSICMVCDFFYPSMGGVENHVYQLSQCLLMQGHTVIIVTHRCTQRCGMRWLPNGLKIYHLPFAPVHDRVLMPSVLLLLPLLRDILIRERIEIVHTHAVCTMALEAVALCSLMDYRVIHTEHSNFGMSSSIDINLNELSRSHLLEIGRRANIEAVMRSLNFVSICFSFATGNQ